MKLIANFSTMLIIAVSTVSCTETLNDADFEKSIHPVSQNQDWIVYPSSDSFTPLTKSELSFETDWEDFNQYESNGRILDMPWSSDFTDANIPKEIAVDIKKEDGWKMLFHTLGGHNISQLYMAFYNIRTGFMKVFYYAAIGESNNNAIWTLSFTSPQKWLNATNEVAIPINLGSLDTFTSSNTVQQQNKGLQIGWNCFLVPLSYNPEDNENQSIEISSLSSNITNVSLFGNDYSYSSGTIVTYGSNNPVSSLNSSVATVIGNTAENWVDDKIADGSLKKNSVDETKSLAGGIAATIVSFALDKALNRLTSSLSQKSSSANDLEFTTVGSLDLNGEFVFSSPNQAMSLRANFSKDAVGSLGVWNLTEQPTIYIHPLADYVPRPSDGDVLTPNYLIRGITGIDYDIIINPDLKPYIKSQKAEATIVRYELSDNSKLPAIPECYNEFGTAGIYDTIRTDAGFISPDSYNNDNLVYDSPDEFFKIFKDNFDDYTFCAFTTTKDNLYPVVYAPYYIPYSDNDMIYINLRKRYLRITLYLTTEINGKEETTISTRTFVPKIDWDPVLVEQYKNFMEEEYGKNNLEYSEDQWEY